MKNLKKGKRGLALCIAMCLFWTLACFAVSRSAAAETVYTDTEQLSDGTLLYRQYETISALIVTGTVSECSGEVIIPTAYSGMSIVEIAAGAFSGQTEITKVTVPGTVQKIGTNAFKGCTSLEQVELENTIQSVGAGAFDETAWSEAHSEDDMMILDDVVLVSVSSALEELYIPETVRVIADEACMEKTSLKTVVLTGYTGYVGDKSFYGCTGLSDVILSSGIKSIGNYAFTESAASRIVIPATVLSIGKGAFLRCTALEQVILWDGIVRIGGSAFASCTSLRQVTIPDSVTELGSSAFKQCTGLQQAVIGKNVAEIQDYVFQGCTSLSSVTINGQISGIGNGAFNKCTALQSVTLPESVVRIGSEAFQSCMSLSEVNIPENVIDIGTRAFFDTAFYNDLRAENSESCFVQYNDTILLGYYGDDTSVDVPDGIKVIAGGAFSSNETIVSVVLPSTIESLSSYAFESMLAMETISGTENLKYIGAYAFWDCISLQSLNIQGDIGVILEGVASGCESLGSVNIQDGITGIETDAFRFSGLNSVSIPESVNYIRAGAFADCESLEHIEILNNDIVLGEQFIPVETEIWCYEGSAAHEYAIAYGNPFIILGFSSDTATTPTETTATQSTTTVTSVTTVSDTSYTTTTAPNTTSTDYTATSSSGTYAGVLEVYTVEISREELESGNYTVTVPVALNNTGGWKSLGYGFSYDTSQLTIESVEISSELAEWIMAEGGRLFHAPAVNHEKGLFWTGLSVSGDADLYCPDGIFSYITFTVNPSVQEGDICRITLLAENNGTKQLAETINGSGACDLTDGAVMVSCGVQTTQTTTTTTATTTTITTGTTTYTTATTTTATTMTTPYTTVTTTTVTSASTTRRTETTTVTTTTLTTETTIYTTATTTTSTTTIPPYTTVTTTTVTSASTTLRTETTTTTMTTTTFQTSRTTTQTTSHMCGDLDGDGKIAIGDASIILSIYAQQAAGLLSEEDIIKKLPLADTDNSGTIEMNDAVFVLTYYAQVCAGITTESFENWRTAQ